MSNRFMISVAALALVAGTGLANAQGTTNRDSGGGAGGAADAAFAAVGGAAERGGSMGSESARRRAPSASWRRCMKPGGSRGEVVGRDGQVRRDEQERGDEKAGASEG